MLHYNHTENLPLTTKSASPEKFVSPKFARVATHAIIPAPKNESPSRRYSPAKILVATLTYLE